MTPALHVCRAALGAALLLSPVLCAAAEGDSPYAIVLGIAQDGGVPQAGDPQHPGWTDPSQRRHPACLGLVDPAHGQRWLLEATPSFPAQLQTLDRVAPSATRPGLDGIFLTHAHVGHYAGLIHLGHEIMGARRVVVHAMPELERFLSTNGPWDQLLRKENIVIRTLRPETPVALNDRLTLVPFRVPHRQEYSEVVGFTIRGPEHALLFLPDIDRWEDLDSLGVSIESLIASVDVAYLDGTFFADGEIPGRDMSTFPHPLITRSLERFAALPETERAKIRFIHLNHTNPALEAHSGARRAIEAAGCRVALELERIDL